MSHPSQQTKFLTVLVDVTWTLMAITVGSWMMLNLVQLVLWGKIIVWTFAVLLMVWVIPSMLLRTIRHIKDYQQQGS